VVAPRVPVPAPERRVHGGTSIVSLFANGMSFGNKSTNDAEASSSASCSRRSVNGSEASILGRGNWL
jgi:hypothetical protein